MAGGKPIRVGVIGCGQFMSRQHIQTVGRDPILKLQHLATRNVEKVERLGKKYNVVRYSTDWQDVLFDPEVDIVVVGRTAPRGLRLTRRQTE